MARPLSLLEHDARAYPGPLKHHSRGTKSTEARNAANPGASISLPVINCFKNLSGLAPPATG